MIRPVTVCISHQKRTVSVVKTACHKRDADLGGWVHTLDVKRKVFLALDLQVWASVRCSVFGVQGRKKASK